jgi:hypothetical protein
MELYSPNQTNFTEANINKGKLQIFVVLKY